MWSVYVQSIVNLSLPSHRPYVVSGISYAVTIQRANPTATSPRIFLLSTTYPEAS
jgi:hypothetical protein